MREKHSVVFISMCVCVRIDACVTCASLCVFLGIFAECLSVLEIKFVWEIE